MARGKRWQAPAASSSPPTIDQKPPSAMPSSDARQQQHRSATEAMAASRLEAISKQRQRPHHQPAVDAPRDDRHGRRGDRADDRRRRHCLSCRAFGDAEIARRCGVSRLAGRNSAVTRPNTPSASETTAPHARPSRFVRRRRSVGNWRPRRSATVFGHEASPVWCSATLGVTGWSFHARKPTMLDHSSKASDYGGDPLTDICAASASTASSTAAAR